RQGITPLDEELARLLRTTGKPTLVAANKVDVGKLEFEAGEFYVFGFAEVFGVSAEQGGGLGDLLDAIVRIVHDDGERLANRDIEPEVDGGTRELRLAIVGRPNVGKSSLLNRLLGSERAIVSPIPGTTRDAVDTVLETSERVFRIIDTAGIRRKGKTD